MSQLPPRRDIEDYVEDQLDDLNYRWGWIRYLVFFACCAVLAWIFLPMAFTFDVKGTREVAAFTAGFVMLFCYIVVGGS